MVRENRADFETVRRGFRITLNRVQQAALSF
jgi:hypothetical protein